MKKLLYTLLCIPLLGCGQDKTISGKHYDTYGLLNKEEERDPNIEYNLIVGNLVWGCLLIETVIAPIYFFGFSLFEPVGPRDPALQEAQSTTMP